LEEKIRTRNSYVTIVGIRVGKFMTKASFWLEVMKIVSEIGVSAIQNKENEVREATGWECSVDRTSVQVFCQLHDVFVDGKRRRLEDEVDPLHLPES
jgi:hypothetical protein